MTPVTYSPASQAIVAAFNALPPAQKDSAYWSDVLVSGVRKEAKDHYLAQQKNHCCYCRRLMQTNNNAVWDGEHVIAKITRPEFLFEPRNLAASCKDCNLAKNDKNVLKNPKRKTFPAKSADYLIVHPHFDTYDDHISWRGNVCAPRKHSKKGQQTIIDCSLMRFSVQALGAEPTVVNPLFDEIIGKLDTASTQAEANDLLEMLRVHFRHLPAK